MNKYYDSPTQVMYYLISVEGEEGQYVPGIAYCDEVICLCCGCVSTIEDIIEMALTDNIPEEKAIIDFSFWADMSDETIKKQNKYIEIADKCF